MKNLGEVWTKVSRKDKNEGETEYKTSENTVER